MKVSFISLLTISLLVHPFSAASPDHALGKLRDLRKRDDPVSAMPGMLMNAANENAVLHAVLRGIQQWIVATSPI
jgi:hypothetical protein